jgi:hypothetical protein
MVAQHVDPGEAVLVITVWHEPGSQHAFRARIVYGPSIEDGPTSAVASDPADVITVVEQWLDGVAD